MLALQCVHSKKLVLSREHRKCPPLAALFALQCYPAAEPIKKAANKKVIQKVA